MRREPYGAAYLTAWPRMMALLSVENSRVLSSAGYGCITVHGCHVSSVSRPRRPLDAIRVLVACALLRG
jgi:hypothetical protein